MGRVVIKRGDIFRIRSEQNSEQTYLVIQNDIGNRFCSSVIVVPLTQNLRSRRLFFSMLIEGNLLTGLEKDYVALFQQIRTLSKEHFSTEGKLGSLDTKSIARMDDLIKLSIGLSTLQQLEDRYRSKKTS
jgi:mRNA interferase MazF